LLGHRSTEVGNCLAHGLSDLMVRGIGIHLVVYALAAQLRFRLRDAKPVGRKLLAAHPIKNLLVRTYALACGDLARCLSAVESPIAMILERSEVTTADQP